MSDETRMILEMLKEGKITVEQAERLLGAVGEQPGALGAEARRGARTDAGASGSDGSTWYWCHESDQDGAWCGNLSGVWSWVGDLGGQIQAEVHRATTEAKAAVEQAMSEARRAGEAARRAGEEARAQVIRIVQEIGRDGE
jgi:hypothetical protein